MLLGLFCTQILFYLFQISGIILLVAMIGAILLHLEKGKCKNKVILIKFQREKDSSVSLVDVKSGKGEN